MRNLSRISAIAGSVFMDAVRKRVVYLVGFFGVIMALAIPSLPSYGLGVATGVYREVCLALTFAASLAIALALAANRIPGEVERRTVYNVLARPVDRLEYIVGTWAGITAVVAASIVGFTIVEQVVGFVKYQDAMWQLWQGALAIGLEASVISAVAIAVSTVSGPVVVVVASLAVVFAGHAREGVLGPDVPSGLRMLYPSLDSFNVINPVAHGAGIGSIELAAMLLTFIGWAGIVLLLAGAGFGRRDL